MKKIHFLYLLLLFANNCLAQITFQRVIRVSNGCVAYSVQQTTDGNYIIAGYSVTSNDSSVDVYLIKTNQHGDTLWTKTFGGIYANYGYSVQQTSDGGYIVAGISTNWSGIINEYIIKTNALGDTLWTKAYALGSSGGLYSSIEQTKDGGYIIIGGYDDVSANLVHVALLRIDANGDSLWNKTYGGSGGEEGFCVKQTPDGGYIACGYTGSFGALKVDIYIIKTNNNGDVLWTKMYGGLLSDEAYSIEPTTDGGYIITGSTESFGAGGGGAFLIKTDANGDTLWTKVYSGIYGIDVQQTSDGGYIICGNDLYVIKTDDFGDTLWTKRYVAGNAQEGSSIQQTSDGGYIITGLTTGFDTIPLNQIYLIKTDSNGNSGCYESGTNTIVGYAPFYVVSTSTIVSSGGFYTPASAIIGSGGNDSTLCLTVGYANENVNNAISLYPNPTDGKLYINYQQMGNSFITVTNVLGQVVKPQTECQQIENPIDVSHLAAGIYFLQLKTESGVSIMKFEKE